MKKEMTDLFLQFKDEMERDGMTMKQNLIIVLSDLAAYTAVKHVSLDKPEGSVW